MSKIKIYNKTIAFLASGTMMTTLVGCNNKEEKPIIETTQTQYTIETTQITETIPIITQYTTLPLTTTTQYTTLPLTTTTQNTTTTQPTTLNIETTTLEETTYTTFLESNEADEIILESFNTLDENIKQNINSEEILEKGKAYFVFCVDFLFYDGEIKGYKFSDMTDAAKQQLLIDITNIDGLISSKYPNYKETINEESSNAYKKASEIIKEGSKNIKEFSREKLGEENYEKIGKYKDMFMEQAFGDFDEFKDLVNQGVGKIKNWYEGLR